jgi:hypothetical protein
MCWKQYFKWLVVYKWAKHGVESLNVGLNKWQIDISSRMCSVWAWKIYLSILIMNDAKEASYLVSTTNAF